MIQIAIPTLGRLDRQVTYKQIPEDYWNFICLWVQGHEFDEAKKKHPDVQVQCLPPKTKGIALTRKIIAKHYAGKRHWVLDDDLKFVRMDAELKAQKMQPKNWQTLFEQINKVLDGGYIHGSLSTHNTPPNPKPLSFNTRMYTNVFYGERFDPSKIDWGEQYELMPEDFYVNLQLLTRGFQNVVFNHYRVNPSATNAKGGCETYRTIELHNRGQEILAEKFPKFVQVYKKVQTSGPWAGKEKAALKIKWKQAYLSSKTKG